MFLNLQTENRGEGPKWTENGYLSTVTRRNLQSSHHCLCLLFCSRSNQVRDPFSSFKITEFQDETIDWSLWYVLIPLWVWKAVVLLGGLVGSLSYARSRQTSPEATVEFKAMIIAVFIHLFLLFFELFLCYQVRENLA